MNLLFCILRSLPGTFVHVLILGLKELKVDYLVMPACTKSLIVQEIKTDSWLAWIYMYFTLVLLKLSTKKIKQKQKEHACTCSFHFDQRSVTVSNFTTHKKAWNAWNEWILKHYLVFTVIILEQKY